MGAITGGALLGITMPCSPTGLPTMPVWVHASSFRTLGCQAWLLTGGRGMLRQLHHSQLATTALPCHAFHSPARLLPMSM